MTANGEYEITVGGLTYQAQVEGQRVIVNGQPFAVIVEDDKVEINGATHAAEIDAQQVIFDGIAYPFDVKRTGAEKGPARKETTLTTAAEGAVTAIMPGKIVRVLVEPGDEVADGAVVCVLEAMKMENELQCVKAGTVKAVHVTPGSDVEMGAILVEIG